MAVGNGVDVIEGSGVGVVVGEGEGVGEGLGAKFMFNVLAPNQRAIKRMIKRIAKISVNFGVKVSREKNWFI